MDAAAQAELVGKIVLAALCGGLIGWQRDRHHYDAGLRTMALVALGATLFTGLNETLGVDRIAANIVTGIGFLGAGIIFREGDNAPCVRHFGTAVYLRVPFRPPCADTVAQSFTELLQRHGDTSAGRRRRLVPSTLDNVTCIWP